MGIRFFCPNGHKLNVKGFQAGRKGICPYCGSKVDIPLESTRKRRRSRDGSRSDSASSGRTLNEETATEISTAPQMPSLSHSPTGNAGLAFSGVKNYSSKLGGGAIPAMREMPSIDSPTATAEPQFSNVPVATPMAAAPNAPSSVAGAAPPIVGADPLADGQNVVWYVRPPSGGQFGPAPGNVMRGWIDEGRVSADSLVWREGWRDWQEASAVFPQLALGTPISDLNEVLDTAVAPSMPIVAPRPKRPAAAKGITRKQLTTILILVAVVVVLVIVFLVVVLKPPAGTPNKPSPASTAAAQFPSAGNLDHHEYPTVS